MQFEPLASRCSALFAKCFGRPPRVLVAAPGRVNLIGEHTDYNEGFVLPMAIDRYTIVAGAKATGREVTVHSETLGETASFAAGPGLARGEPTWSNYIRGVIAGFQERGLKVPGFDAVLDSAVPIGGGVSSSAALEVGIATLFEQLIGQRLDPVEKALLCQRAEHQFARVPCGIMDQFTSVFAQENHALLLDCRSRTAQPIPMKDPAVAVMVINTNVRHKLSDGEYARRRAECEEAARTLGVTSLRDVKPADLPSAEKRLAPVVFRRTRHVVTENERTVEAAHAIERGEWSRVGELMAASHKSLRDDYQVSSLELDTVVAICNELGAQSGVMGCRMTGAGFGGCVVALVRTDHVLPVTRKVAEIYERKTGYHAAIFSSRPAGGARVLDIPG